MGTAVHTYRAYKAHPASALRSKSASADESLIRPHIACTQKEREGEREAHTTGSILQILGLGV